ncbi:hypothetical protein GO493_29855 [Chitinophaga sp. ysch24]|uniref:Uncharacterized protein n=1 Tax=Chitinophaga tropicalis TaxID=2683588 RepID=A0A7K1UDN2_9BACT|nr:hypothetical protein [Chitinophaga tropicalis]
MVLILYNQKQSIADIRNTLKIGSNATVYRYLKDATARTEQVKTPATPELEL